MKVSPETLQGKVRARQLRNNPQLSDREIGRLAGVAGKTVAKARKTTATTVAVERVGERYGLRRLNDGELDDWRRALKGHVRPAGKFQLGG